MQPDNPAGWTVLALTLGNTPAGRGAWQKVLALNPLDTKARAALEVTG